MSLQSAIKKVEGEDDLSVDEARNAFDEIFHGQASDENIAQFLLDLAKKGETHEELMGAVISMRAKAITIEAPPDAMDIVGTGGDHTHTLNISTAVAIVVASCGVPVAKHGNRASSSRSGSSDLLRELGINLEPDLAVLDECLEKANICFLYAPRHHPAMRHVAEIRRRLGVRTIFNLLGPLTNPANVKRHLIGVYELEWLGPMAAVLQQLGSDTAWLAHGHDEMDEITTTDETDIVAFQNNIVQHMTISPEEYGLQRANLSDLYGENATSNAVEMKRLFRGVSSPYRDIVLLNSGAALTVAGKVDNVQKGMTLAAHALDSGDAYGTLDKLVQLTNAVHI
jgi:anthranilate phosphoribosyltransferase